MPSSSYLQLCLLKLVTIISQRKTIYEANIKGIFVTKVTNKTRTTIEYFIFKEELSPFQLLGGMGKY